MTVEFMFACTQNNFAETERLQMRSAQMNGIFWETMIKEDFCFATALQ